MPIFPPYSRILTDSRGYEADFLPSDALFPVECYLDYPNEEERFWHWHDKMELFVVLEGRVLASAGSMRYELQAGDGLFLNAAILHETHRAGSAPCSIQFLLFDPEIVGGNAGSVYWQNYLLPLTCGDTLPSLLLSPTVCWQSECLHLIQKIWKDCQAMQYGYEFSVRGQLSHLLLLLISHSPAARFPDIRTLQDDLRMKLMLQYIHAHYAESINVSQIAASALISESEALRCFRLFIHTTPIQYVKKYRLMKAAKLLISGREKIASIAKRCGFQKTGYFTSAFRETYGCTPSEYRKKCIRSVILL